MSTDPREIAPGVRRVSDADFARTVCELMRTSGKSFEELVEDGERAMAELHRDDPAPPKLPADFRIAVEISRRIARAPLDEIVKLPHVD